MYSEEMIDYIDTTIKIYSHKLRGRFGITDDKLQDIRSIIMVDVLRRLPRHDKKWSFKTLVPILVQNQIHKILHKRFNEAGKHEYQVFRASQRNEKELKKLEASDGLLSDQDLVALKFDVRIVLQILTPEQRRCCEMLMDGKTLIEVAVEMKMSRTTFYKTIIEPITKVFIEQGLDRYVKKY